MSSQKKTSTSFTY
ncbi:uncharacterized protein FFNC_15719 [Fusarium fujikuroi]|nr:uncharacterized protein FFNC_15719 [Fusarium fujikuroi]